jgi:amidohydrolase
VVREWLERHGYEPRYCAGTGLVADLRPKGPGRTIALRADLDALPMEETTDLPYRSMHSGRAHKCGHDGHTALLMGAAAILANHRDDLAGNVRLLFQPAEEGVRGGGARVMIEEGVLEGVDEVYGLHTWPGWPKGELRTAAGPIMARVDTFKIHVHGKGGHGSQPELCRDPITAGCYLVGLFRSAVPPATGGERGAVVSVCSFNSGTADNVIPDVAELGGTIRSFSDDFRAQVLERLQEAARDTSEQFAVEVNLDITEAYPVLVNDVSCAEVVRKVAGEVLGPGNVDSSGLPMTASEDFAYYAAQCPAAFFFLGAGHDGEETPGCHHPDFDFDDDLIPVGIELFLRIVADRLGC